MWPAYAYGHTAVRWAGLEAPLRWEQPVPYLVHERYSLSPKYLLGFVIPVGIIMLFGRKAVRHAAVKH